MKKSISLLCIGLLFTACAKQTKHEMDMDFVDDVKVALADSGHVNLNSLQILVFRSMEHLICKNLFLCF